MMKGHTYLTSVKRGFNERRTFLAVVGRKAEMVFDDHLDVLFVYLFSFI